MCSDGNDDDPLEQRRRASTAKQESAWKIKYIALALLVLQTVGSVFLLRYSQSGPNKYISSTSVVLAEVVKAIASVSLLVMEHRGDFNHAFREIFTEALMKPRETIYIAIPALLYGVQNNLLFVATRNLNGALYQVIYQLKIVATAILSVVILGMKLDQQKWIAICCLTGGAAITPLDESLGDRSASKVDQDLLIGVSSVLLACVTSGLAGVLLEKTLKTSSLSVWLRNFQLAIVSIFLNLGIAVYYNYATIRDNGFFFNYTPSTWAAIFVLALGGMIIAAVMKYADNILKCFGNAVSIVLQCLVSYFVMKDFVPGIWFFFGTLFVLCATVLYSIPLKKSIASNSLV